MAAFDYFAFMNGRRNSVEPTEDEKNSFNLYMCQMILSMTTTASVINVLDKMNTMAFFDLPKPIQCMAFTTLDGVKLDTKWKKSKGGSTTEVKELIEKVMKVYNMSHNDAVSCVKCNTINVETVEELYTLLYESDTIKFRKAKGKKEK